MDLFAILESLRRHWVMTVAVAMTTAVTAGGVLFLMPRNYEAMASYVLVNPAPGPSESQLAADPALADINRNNPYMRFSSQATVSQVLAVRVSGDSVRQSLIASGADGDYSIAPSVDFGGSGYIIDIVGTGSSPEEAVRTLEAVAQRMQDELRAMQKIFDADDSALITALPIAQPTGARLMLSGTVRSLVGIVSAGVIFLFAAISIAEARVSMRSRFDEDERGIVGRHATRAWQATDTGSFTPQYRSEWRQSAPARSVEVDTGEKDHDLSLDVSATASR